MFSISIYLIVKIYFFIYNRVTKSGRTHFGGHSNEAVQSESNP